MLLRKNSSEKKTFNRLQELSLFHINCLVQSFYVLLKIGTNNIFLILLIIETREYLVHHSSRTICLQKVDHHADKRREV